MHTHARSVIGIASVVVVAFAAIPPAAADEPSAKQVIGSTVWRARRAVALGVTVGSAVGYLTTPGEVEGAFSFGIGLRLFKIQVLPDRKRVEEVAKERAKAKLAEYVKRLIAEGKPPPEGAELEQAARDIFDEIKAQLVADLVARQAKRIEKPRFALQVEGERLLRSEAWLIRTTLGIGISKITLGPTFALFAGDDTGLFAGPEVTLHIQLGKGARSSLIDVFLRGDFGISAVTEDVTQVSLGARFLLDLI